MVVITVYAGLTIPSYKETPLAPCHILMVLYAISLGYSFLYLLLSSLELSFTSTSHLFFTPLLIVTDNNSSLPIARSVRSLKIVPSDFFSHLG